MSEENKSDHGSLLKGILIGGIAGAIVALMYAPKAGKELREEIKKKSSELKDELDKKYEETKETASKIVEENINRVEILQREAEEKLKQAQKLAIDILEMSKKKYDEFSENIDVSDTSKKGKRQNSGKKNVDKRGEKNA